MNTRQRVRMVDVAAIAGVSPMTISRVLSGSPLVSREISKKVEDACRQLNYTCNYVARSLKTGSSQVIGLIVPDLIEPLYSSVVQAIVDAASHAGFSVFLKLSRGDRDIELKEAVRLNAMLVHGLIRIAPVNESSVFSQVNSDVCIVVGVSDNTQFKCCTVRLAVEHAMKASTEHLVRHGHKQIALLCEDSGRSLLTPQVIGYHHVMQRHGLIPRVHKGCNSEARIRKILSCGIEVPYTAVITDTRASTKATWSVIGELQISVPSELAFVGHGLGIHDEHLRRKITNVYWPIAEIGKAAVEAIVFPVRKVTNEPSCTAVEGIFELSCSCGCLPQDE